MEKSLSYSFSENYLEKLAAHICKEYLSKNTDLSRVACVFGGRRPGLFLRREISKLTKKSFIPPRILTIDELVSRIISPGQALKAIGDLDAFYLIYQLAKENIPGLLKQRSSFSQFLPWAGEIVSFIEQLDLEDISNDSLATIQKSAAIGYEVPASINSLLKKIIKIRKNYHSRLKKNALTSRGMRYLMAADLAADNDLPEFDRLIFCNFFYLHSTEERIVRGFLEQGKAQCIFQGRAKEWPVLSKNAKGLNLDITPSQAKKDDFSYFLHQGFDMHSQICLLKNLLKKEVKPGRSTVIVLPRPASLVPLLSEISAEVKEFNVSMGYPLARSPLYELFYFLAKAQESAKSGKYYAKDYLALMKHPLVKTLEAGLKEPSLAGLVYKAEDALTGRKKSAIGGSLFISLDDIEKEPGLAALSDIHSLFFRAWESLTVFEEFCRVLENLLKVLLKKSRIGEFKFNLGVIDSVFSVKEDLANSSFSREVFQPNELWEIFQQRLQAQAIPFLGSPLKGLQILGLFETRSLNFDNVIILDANETVLPKLKIYEPLIPREVMLNLGLNRLEKEEEIQRYQFMRLIYGAKRVDLIYQENQQAQKSRFIEELLWKNQRKSKELLSKPIPKASFSIKTAGKNKLITKTPEMVAHLKKATYSASRVNTYLDCPLNFYYRYLLGFKEQEDLLAGPQSSCIGTFIHELLEETFARFKGKKPLINREFRNYFKAKRDEKFALEIAPRMKSDSFLLAKIIENRLDKFLDNEETRPVKELICLEAKCKSEIAIAGQLVNFQYTIDRIDRLEDDRILVIDYKSGASSYSPKRLSALEKMPLSRESLKDNIKSFQLPLYYYFTIKEFSRSKVNAELYSIRTLQRTPFISPADYPQRQRVAEICMEALNFLVSEIFDPEVGFCADKNKRRCQFCPYTYLCR